MNYTGFFDSHAHYDDPAFDEDREMVLQKISAAGVTRVVNIGADLPSSKRSVELANRHKGFYATIGVHPNESQTYDQKTEDIFRQFALDEKVVGIGEIGLDYHYDCAPKATQIEVFKKQLHLAKTLELPVVIHSREAITDTVAILSESPPSSAVIHSFSGSAETAVIYLKMGFYLGFTGLVTFKNVRKVLDALEIIPLERILLETDCPYMSPVPYRGKRCDGSMIVETAKKIAEVKNLPIDMVIQQTAQNAENFYHL